MTVTARRQLEYSDAVRRFATTHSEILRVGSRFTLTRSPHLVKLPTELNNELCWLVGLIQGDGNISGTRVLICDSEKRFHVTISRKFREQFGIALNVFHDRNRNSYYSYVKSRIVTDFLAEVFGLPKGKKRRLVVPHVISSGPLECRAAYVRGLFDAEGYVSSRQAALGITISDLSVARFVSKVLNDLGVKCLLRTRHRLDGRRECEVETYGGDDLRTFIARVGTEHCLKAHRLRKFVQLH